MRWKLRLAGAALTVAATAPFAPSARGQEMAPELGVPSPVLPAAGPELVAPPSGLPGIESVPMPYASAAQGVPAYSSGQVALPGIEAVPTPYSSRGTMPEGLAAPQYQGPGKAAPAVPGVPYGPSEGMVEPGSPYTAPGMPPAAAPYTGMDGLPGAPGATAPGAAAPPAAFAPPEAGGLGGDLSALTAGEGGPGAGLGGDGGAAPAAFSMLGDLSPLIGVSQVAPPIGSNPPPLPPAGPSIAPSVRGFKLADNMSPQPQDRLFFTMNFYDDVNKKLNRFYESPLQSLQIYRYMWGFEKTFNNGNGSIGMRLPLDTISAQSREPALQQGGTYTSLGNLTIFAKHVFAYDRRTGSLVSGGLAITPRTGPRQFAGAPYLAANNTTTIQPYVGYLVNFRKWYFHGFEAIDVPAAAGNPTLVYSDIGMGYYLYREQIPTGWISAVVPTFEVHINNPINHRGEYNVRDPNGTPDIVNLTYGLNVRLKERSVLSLGLATPVTGPRPFDLEAILLFNYYFGKAPRSAAYPFLGGG